MAVVVAVAAVATGHAPDHRDWGVTGTTALHPPPRRNQAPPNGPSLRESANTRDGTGTGSVTGRRSQCLMSPKLPTMAGVTTPGVRTPATPTRGRGTGSGRESTGSGMTNTSRATAPPTSPQSTPLLTEAGPPPPQGDETPTAPPRTATHLPDIPVTPETPPPEIPPSAEERGERSTPLPSPPRAWSRLPEGGTSQ